MNALRSRPLRILQGRRAAVLQLERRLENMQAGFENDADGGRDDLDRASELETRESVAGLAAVLSLEHRQINDAMRRLRAGAYGICEECGRRIAAERLELWPEATRCVECQRRQETHMHAHA